MIIIKNDRRSIAILGMHEATAWGSQIGPAWLRIRFPRFWRTSGAVQVGWDKNFWQQEVAE